VSAPRWFGVSDHTELGTTIEVETPKASVGGAVVQMPHWDPNKEIPKG
jgi:hypothetical protein